MVAQIAQIIAAYNCKRNSSSPRTSRTQRRAHTMAGVHKRYINMSTLLRQSMLQPSMKRSRHLVKAEVVLSRCGAALERCSNTHTHLQFRVPRRVQASSAATTWADNALSPYGYG